jgi:hypothetical protein
MTTVKTMALILGLVVLAVSPAWADGSATGQLTNVTVQSTGVVLFSTTGAHTGAPACATTGRFAFNAATAAGQATLAVLLTAYGLGKQVTVFGTGACDVWSDSETVFYIVSP